MQFKLHAPFKPTGDQPQAIAWASFLPREEKTPVVRLATRKVDTLKVLLMVLWENQSLKEKQFISLSDELEEIGRMLGGWLGQLKKQNPARIPSNGETK